MDVEENLVIAEAEQEAEPSGVTDDSLPDMDAVRELVLRAHPQAVPELIGGATVAELLASVPVAEDAYARIAAAVQKTRPVVTGGGGVRSTAVDLEGLGPLAKIRAGLRHS